VQAVASWEPPDVSDGAPSRSEARKPVKITARWLLLALVALIVTGCANDGPLQSALEQGVVLHWSIPIPVEGGLASKVL
jgi:hypothetical protein